MSAHCRHQSRFAVSVYLNGELIYSGGGPTALNTSLFRIGQWGGGSSSTENWQGKVDDVRLWNYARTAQEIAAHYACPLTGMETGLEVYWPLDQGVAESVNTGLTAAIDLSPGGSNGTLNDFALEGSHSNWVCGCENCANTCACGSFTNLAIGRKGIAGMPPISISLECGSLDTMPCPIDDRNWALTGDFACTGSCEPTNMLWEITDQDDHIVASGTINDPSFLVYFSGSAISEAGTYTITYQATCGEQTCSCAAQIIVNCPTEPQPVDTFCGKAVVTCYAYPGLPSAAIIDVRNNSSAPLGDDWLNPMAGGATAKTMYPNWSVDRIGNIFGIAIDQNNNVYFGASDVYNFEYGSSILPYYSGTAGTGGIYKALGTDMNNVIDLVVSTGNVPVVGANQIPNTGGWGNGIGNLAFDRLHNQLFATNLEDGRIYRINPSTGVVIDVYDPFLSDDGLNGLAPVQERLWAIGVYSDGTNTTLYFSRNKFGTTGHRVYSLNLTPGGGFPGAATAGIYSGGGETVEFECGILPDFQCSGSFASTKISDIEFSGTGKMLLSYRGNPHQALVYELEKTGANWTVIRQLFIGPNNGQNSAGGVDYGYKEVNRDITAKCDSIIWATGNYMQASQRPSSHRIYGLEGINANTGNSLPPANQSSDIFIDFDGDYNTGDKWQIGDVDIFKCLTCVEVPPCDSITASVTPLSPAGQTNGACCYQLTLDNHYANAFSAVQISIEGASIDVADVTPAPGWAIVGFTAGTSITLEHSGGYVPDGVFTCAGFCLSDVTYAIQNLTIDYLDNQGNSMCFDLLETTCDFCIEVISDSVACHNGGAREMTFCIKVAPNLGHNLNSIILSAPGVTFMPSIISLPNLEPGDEHCVTTLVHFDDGGLRDQLCFGITVHEANVTLGLPPLRCCMIDACVDMPVCPCDSAFTYAMYESAEQLEEGLCCYDITIHQLEGTVISVGAEVLTPGAEFSGVENTVGWDATWITLPRHIEWTPAPALPLPAVATLPTVCFAGESPQEVLITWETENGEICEDLLVFNCGDSICAAFDSISLNCLVFGDQASELLFSVTNLSGLTATHVALVNISPGVAVTGPTVFDLTTDPVLNGETVFLSTTFKDDPGTEICFQINLYYHPDSLTYTDCCLTEEFFCVTMPDCSFAPPPSGMTVAPNPTQSDVIVRFQRTVAPESQLRFYDVAGKLIREEAINAYSITHRISLADLPPGMYYVEWVENGIPLERAKLSKR